MKNNSITILYLMKKEIFPGLHLQGLAASWNRIIFHV